MSDADKMMAFGTWLTTRKAQHTAELFSLSLNTKAPVDALRIKAGHVEAFSVVLDAFTELYRGDVTKFNEAYLDIPIDEEDDDKE